MSRVIVYATHEPMKPTGEVPGCPYEYVLRLAHETETAAAGELLRRALKISGVRERMIEMLEADERRLRSALRDIRHHLKREDAGEVLRRIARVISRVDAHFPLENGK